ncbi:aromatic ring hydroxylase [Streptomyces sp. AS58]|uniref:FAD-dependent monooxygenase n=1 Tax=Streptomyces sp. AS58 TaxID=1519489 RepID=UPI0006BED5B4|nr:FAD-dependent monooxygenase [Streptomyces sp. AS58]KOV53314.1 aromatic ring hydroxylase [Streptomyces sp. AS58]
MDVPVLVIGGGPAGLAGSILLSRLGIDHMLVERHPSTSPYPKAHLINPRTLEILRQAGVADDVYEIGGPPGEYRVRFQTSLGGDGPLDGRELFAIDGFGGGSLRASTERATPCPHTNLPQLRLEPVLRRHAEQHGHATVLFGHEFVRYDEDADGVTALVRDCRTGQNFTVRAQYLIGADGGKTLAHQLGVTLEGPRSIARLVSNHISADLSDHVQGDALITLLMHPENPFKFVGLVPMGPSYGKGTDWARESEEWGVSFALRPEDGTTLTEDTVAPIIRQALRLPDLDLTVHRTSTWGVERVVADRFRYGRVFLVGDAAHRHVPTSGLGLNSAVQDVHNLAWKIAAVVRGQAGPDLLDTYEAERRPADVRNADWALFTFMNNANIDVGLGLSASASQEQNIAALAAYLSDTQAGATLRARGAEIIATQRTEYQALDIELGFSYESAAIVPDGTPRPPSDPLGLHYRPTTRPGHRLPHAWLQHGTERMSTHDLTGVGDSFALITGRGGDAWRKAAAAMTEELGVAITTACVGAADGYLDPTGEWGQVSDIADDGAVLVRPDNHVAWRIHGSVQDPAHELRKALSGILAR